MLSARDRSGPDPTPQKATDLSAIDPPLPPTATGVIFELLLDGLALEDREQVVALIRKHRADESTARL